MVDFQRIRPLSSSSSFTSFEMAESFRYRATYYDIVPWYNNRLASRKIHAELALIKQLLCTYSCYEDT